MHNFSLLNMLDCGMGPHNLCEYEKMCAKNCSYTSTIDRYKFFRISSLPMPSKKFMLDLNGLKTDKFPFYQQLNFFRFKTFFDIHIQFH